PEEAYQLYRSLSDSIRNLPTHKIRDYLANMELIIQSQLEKILGYSGIECSDGATVESVFMAGDGVDENPLDLLEEFKRTAQTAVSLKVLLKQRGVGTEGLVLPVPQEAIRQQLRHLDEQEQQQRVRAREKITEMKQDIDGMLQNRAYPEAMKAMLKDVQRNLDRDLKRIDSGGSLAGLSFIADAESVTALEAPEEVVLEAPSADDEADTPGFSEMASRWLNTPWDTTWEDIKKGR
ncbi:MAG: hypothetical protein OQL28_11655, partial [Sedimenticola sp.]|nr:hypothetical protein [Sedimenticola sp.]